MLDPSNRTTIPRDGTLVSKTPADKHAFWFSELRALTLAVGLAPGCSSTTDAVPDGIGSVTFQVHHLTTVPGAWFEQLALVRDTGGAQVAVQPGWSSSQPDVATVDATGVIRVVASGTARIVARVGSHADTLTIDATRVRFLHVAVGSEITCGYTTTSDVFCWGAVLLPDSLGDEVASHLVVRAPVRVAHLSGVQHLTLGFEHSCALANDIAVCWGGNRFGILGLGSSDTLLHPIPTAVPGYTFIGLDAGAYFTCGLAAGGAVHCWGYNGHGEVGAGPFGTARPSPVTISGGPPFQTVTAGLAHACGLDAAGVASCWGNSFSVGPAADTASCLPAGECPVPLPVDTGLHFIAINTWGEHTCGLTAAQTAWCWGGNRYWQLGAETIADHSFQPVMVTGNVSFTSIVTAAYHSCGLTAAGEAWCWGDNSAGQIGIGQAEFGARFATPVAVVGGHSFDVLRAGGGVTCGITAAGRVYCWGANNFGTVGDGSDWSVREVPVPTEVVGQQ